MNLQDFSRTVYGLDTIGRPSVGMSNINQVGPTNMLYSVRLFAGISCLALPRALSCPPQEYPHLEWN